MAVDKLSPWDVDSFPAGSDLSTKQYFAVKLTTGKLALAGASDAVLGILQDKPNAVDKQGTVALRGKSKAVAGAAITAGAQVEADAAGKLVAATGGAGTHNIVGIAITGAGADLEVFSLHIDRSRDTI